MMYSRLGFARFTVPRIPILANVYTTIEPKISGPALRLVPTPARQKISHAEHSRGKITSPNIYNMYTKSLIGIVLLIIGRMPTNLHNRNTPCKCMKVQRLRAKVCVRRLEDGESKSYECTLFEAAAFKTKNDWMDHEKEHFPWSHSKKPRSSRRHRNLRKRSRCGFCEETFTSWTERANHIFQHYKTDAKTTADWRGNWGFPKDAMKAPTNTTLPSLRNHSES